MTRPLRDGRRTWAARLGLLGAYAALLAAGLGLSQVLPALMPPETGAGLLSPAVLACLLLYAVALALPFVPGAEIGLGVLMLYGAAAAPVVWMATVTGLSLAYLMGRFVPAGPLARGLAALGLARAASLVAEAGALPEAERGALLARALPGGAQGWLARSRWLALAVLFNLPGNALIGGGGGIAFAAGASRLFAPLPFVLVVAVAVSPVPVLFRLWGG